MRALSWFAVATTLALFPVSAHAGHCSVAQKWDAKHAAAVAAKIAGGHAWTKHAGEYYGTAVNSAAKFKSLLEKIVKTAGVGLSGARHKWWDTTTATFVVFNPKDNDCGTAFKPTAGKSYYDNQN